MAIITIYLMAYLIVDEYLNSQGHLVVGLRESMHRDYVYLLSRKEAEALRDELARALSSKETGK